MTNIDICINGSKLQSVKYFKYLCLMVVQKLKWIDHIAHLKLKVAQGLGIINKAKPFLTKIPHEFILFFNIPIFYLLCASLMKRSNFSSLTTMFTSI